MKKRNIILVGVIFLAVICILALGTFFLLQRDRQPKSPPLIQIHQPYLHEQLLTSKGTLIYATAEAQEGMRKMELWVDGEMISEKDIARDVPVSKLVLSAGWVPYPAGDHSIIIRATSASGETSLASIQVEAVERPAYPPVKYAVQEEQPIERIATAFGLPVENILELNPGLDAQSVLETGEELLLPAAPPDPVPSFDEEPEGTEEPEPEADLPDVAEEPEGTEEPEPEADLPDIDEHHPEPALEVEPLYLEILTTIFSIQIPTQLQIEILSLETQEAYSFLHCYASLAGADPRWVPDADFNQSTDESFASLAGGGTTWDVADHFANDNAMDLAWVMSEPVPLDVSCVGVLDGGMEAVELGRVADSVEPERWGIAQSAYSVGGEASFRMTYSVSHPAKGLDTSISPPFNVRINEEHHSLSWDYPTEEIEAIDGFAILLNDTLQWRVHHSIQSTDLPQQWFTLPCGDEYQFTVVAYKMGYPDGDYSLPSNPAVISGEEVGGEGCNRTILVSFETLTTGSLGRNPSPVYGVFYATDEMLEFDGRPIEGDNFPSSFGLAQNENYDISRIMYGFGNNQTQLIVELPPGQPHIEESPLWIGFDIYQGGSRVCGGEVRIPEDRYAGTYSGAIQTEDPIGALPDWCVVNYSIQHLGETPVVEPGAPPPLPNLVVQEISLDPIGRRPRIHIRNVGLASWVEQTITAQVATSDGEPIGIYEWPNQTLAPGENRILSHGGLAPDPPLDICVLLDPENLVEEETDRLIEQGIFAERHTYCRPLPDLSIAQVSFDQETGRLSIDIQNRGEDPISSADSGGTLDHTNLMIWLEFEEGRPITQEFPALDLGFRETTTLTWPLNELQRERMRAGYQVVINPNQAFAELDYENNAYQVGETAKLRITWSVGWASFCETGIYNVYGENIGGKNDWQLHLTANVQGGSNSRQVADWDSPHLDITWREGNGGDSWCQLYQTDWFEVSGDESLVVTPWAGLDISAHGYRWFSGGSEALTSINDFGGTTHVPPETAEYCFTDGVSYPCICTGCTFCQCGCGALQCSRFGDDGEHVIGPIGAHSEDITNSCYWSSTYTIYREVPED